MGYEKPDMKTEWFNRFSDAVYRVLGQFIDPLGLGPEARSQRLFALLVAIFSVPMLLFYSILSILDGYYFLAGFLVVIGLVITVSLFIGRGQKNVAHLYRIIVVMLGILFLYLLFTSANQPRRIPWVFIFPLEAFFLLGRKEGLIVNVVYYGLAACILAVSGEFYHESALSPEQKIDILVALLVIILIANFFESTRMKYYQGMTRRQEELEVSNQNLQQEIQKRTEMEKTAVEALNDLKQAQVQLVQSGKLASIGELSSGIAHELNQPLMVIRGNAQMLHRRETKSEYPSAENLRQLAMIERNTGRMMDIINHLRTFSRQSKGEFRPVPINTVVSDCLLMVSEQLRLHNIQVNLLLGDDLPEVMGDQTQIEQVVLNLLTNAKDAIERDRSDSGSRGVIDVVTRVSPKTGRNVEVLVTDTGGGIAEDHLLKIFDPFFTTKEVGRGTGLGLSISYGIVAEHGGGIEVLESGPGGTTLKIEFSCADSHRESGT